MTPQECPHEERHRRVTLTDDNLLKTRCSECGWVFEARTLPADEAAEIRKVATVWRPKRGSELR